MVVVKMYEPNKKCISLLHDNDAIDEENDDNDDNCAQEKTINSRLTCSNSNKCDALRE